MRCHVVYFCMEYYSGEDLILSFLDLKWSDVSDNKNFHNYNYKTINIM